MEPQVFHEKWYLIESRWRWLLVAPLALGVVGLYAVADQRRGLLAGGPLLLLLNYGVLVLLTSYREVRLDVKGFQRRTGPLPVGVGRDSHNATEVTHLFPRHIREGVAKGVVEDRYYAAVELASGRWVNVRGHYADWAGASSACVEVARLWNLPEIAAGRQGYPTARDWRPAIVTMLWGGAFFAAMAWGVYFEIRR